MLPENYCMLVLMISLLVRFTEDEHAALLAKAKAASVSASNLIRRSLGLPPVAAGGARAGAGRKPNIPNEIMKRFNGGLSRKRIAAELGISLAEVNETLKHQGSGVR
jgi:hypothetical protein